MIRTAGRKSRILVVDDHPFVRQGIIALINRQSDLTCCGEAEGIRSAKLSVAAEQPDLLLLDLSLRDGDAFDLIEHLTSQFPSIRILVLSHYGEMVHIRRVLQLGAKGYVMKEAAAAELLPAIQAVLAGESYVNCSATNVGCSGGD